MILSELKIIFIFRELLYDNCRCWERMVMKSIYPFLLNSRIYSRSTRNELRNDSNRYVKFVPEFLLSLPWKRGIGLQSRSLLANRLKSHVTRKCWEILGRVNFSDSRYSRDSRGEPCNFNYIFIEEERIYPWMIDNARGVIFAGIVTYNLFESSLFQPCGTSRSISNRGSIPPTRTWKYLLYRALMSDHMHPFRLIPSSFDGSVRRVFSPPPKKDNEIGK